MNIASLKLGGSMVAMQHIFIVLQHVPLTLPHLSKPYLEEELPIGYFYCYIGFLL